MTFIIFVIILGVLVLVHELGHFIFAKKAGVRVEEFGFGYPPRALTLGERWGTKFSLNWIPFGGFVKIFGENYESVPEPESPSRVREFSAENSLSARSVESRKPREGLSGSRFTDVSKHWQALILFAGVLFNIIFAWLLFSLTFIIGMPTSVENDMNLAVQNPALMVVSVLANSPAEIAGIKPGDKIINVKNLDTRLSEISPEAVSAFIKDSSGAVYFGLDRGNKIIDIEVVPTKNIAENTNIVGITMDYVGTLRLSPIRALYEGGKTTFNLIYLTVAGIIGLIVGAFMGTADLSQVTGPVGIVGLVGDASRLGFTYLLTFTALISINLAVVNLLPFPALDGGRLLFVAVESITRKKISAKFGTYANGIGFAVLILLMLVITFKDIKNLF